MIPSAGGSAEPPEILLPGGALPPLAYPVIFVDVCLWRRSTRRFRAVFAAQDRDEDTVPQRADSVLCAARTGAAIASNRTAAEA